MTFFQNRLQHQSYATKEMKITHSLANLSRMENNEFNKFTP